MPQPARKNVLMGKAATASDGLTVMNESEGTNARKNERSASRSISRDGHRGRPFRSREDFPGGTPLL